MPTRRLDIGWLRVFDAVGRLGSLTRAARELNMSQPAVSYQVRRIEDLLGVELLRRQHRGSVLTEAGERLQRAVRESVAGLDKAAEDIARQSRKPVIRIFTDYGFAAYWLMPRVADFRREHPEFEVHVIASQGLDEDLEDAADATVLFGEGSDFAADARLLIPERVVPVCSPGFLARHGPFPDAASLSRAPLLHLDTVGRPRWFTWTSWLATLGVQREPAQGDLGLNTYGFVIQAALAEQGVALGWLGLVDAHLQSGTLVAIGEEVASADRGYWLAFRAGASNDMRLLVSRLLGVEHPGGGSP
jgi:putative choline sulfate-utilization transcription factor